MKRYFGSTLISLMATVFLQNALAAELAGETSAQLSMHKKGHVNKSQNFAFPELGFTSFEFGTARSTHNDLVKSTAQVTQVQIAHGFAEDAMFSVSTGFSKTTADGDSFFEEEEVSSSSITPIKATVLGLKSLDAANFYYGGSLMHAPTVYRDVSTRGYIRGSIGEAQYYGATTLIPTVGIEKFIETGLVGFQATAYMPMTKREVSTSIANRFSYTVDPSVYLKGFYEIPVNKWAEFGTGVIYGSSEAKGEFDVLGLTAYSQIKLPESLSMQINFEGYNQDQGGLQADGTNVSVAIKKTL